MSLKVIDLFSGLNGWSGPWKERGHETFTVDLEPAFHPDLVADVLTLTPADLPFWPDVVLASPPCEGFSVLRIGYNWTPPPENAPKTEHARLALVLAEATVALIRRLDPRFWIIENPRAKLRTLPVMQGIERRTVTYCQYGDTVMKPTDLWGGFPPSLWLRGACGPNGECHERAPRQSTTRKRGLRTDRSGTTGKRTSALRALIPRELSLAICEAAERDSVWGTRWAA